MPIRKIGDIDIEYYEEGEGPPLLLIMGLAGRASSWSERFLELLRPRFKVIRFSNRGMGTSECPAGEFTVRMMAEDAVGLLGELDIHRAHVMGISMGGMIAQELVLNHPGLVRGLVLGCTTCGGTQGIPTPAESAQAFVPQQGQSMEEMVRKLLEVSTTPEFVVREKAFIDEMLRDYVSSPPRMDVVMRQMAAVAQFSTYDRLPEIKAPTLIVHGEEDRLLPFQNAGILKERIAGAEMKPFPGVGHMFFWERHEETADAIVEFLSSVAAPA
jgi:pimeloyl-ACP methyl ester carboxylesterase